MKHEYQSVLLPMPGDVKTTVSTFSKGIDENDLSSEGLETQPHVTVLFGLKDQPVKNIREIVEGFGPVSFHFGLTKVFEGEGQDVLFAEVLGRQVEMLHLMIGSELPVFATHPLFRPHMTIGYFKKGEARKYSGDRSFENMYVTVDKVQFSSENETTEMIYLKETA